MYHKLPKLILKTVLCSRKKKTNEKSDDTLDTFSIKYKKKLQFIKVTEKIRNA